MSSLRSIVLIPAVILSTATVTSLAGDLEAANIAADAVHSNGKTAIMQAARAGNESAVEQLIEIGADISRTNNNGGTPLMYAVLGGNVAIVRMFIQMGVDLDAMADNGWSALMIAAAKGRAESVKELLNHSADPNLPDIYGWTPLMRAVFENRVFTARLLMEDSRTRLNHRGENGVTALHIATVRGQVNLAEMLLENGADSSLQDEVGRTPYQIALKNNDPELLALLKGDTSRTPAFD